MKEGYGFRPSLSRFKVIPCDSSFVFVSVDHTNTRKNKKSEVITRARLVKEKVPEE
jgi:hypothetical protein